MLRTDVIGGSLQAGDKAGMDETSWFGPGNGQRLSKKFVRTESKNHRFFDVN